MTLRPRIFFGSKYSQNSLQWQQKKRVGQNVNSKLLVFISEKIEKSGLPFFLLFLRILLDIPDKFHQAFHQTSFFTHITDVPMFSLITVPHKRSTLQKLECLSPFTLATTQMDVYEQRSHFQRELLNFKAAQ